MNLTVYVLHCKVFNVLHMVISILFFTSPYNLFVFQSTITNWLLVAFYLFIYFIYSLLLCIGFFLYHLSLSLSLSLHWQPIVIQNLMMIPWHKICIISFLFLFFNLVFLTWFVLYFIFPLMHWVWEWVFPQHYFT